MIPDSLSATFAALADSARRAILARREAQWRPCRPQAAPLKTAAGWIEAYRHHWQNNL
jgi:hypothetical protein